MASVLEALEAVNGLLVSVARNAGAVVGSGGGDGGSSRGGFTSTGVRGSGGGEGGSRRTGLGASGAQMAELVNLQAATLGRMDRLIELTTMSVKGDEHATRASR